MPRPGEVSLAHNGVLFLDEFPEFPRNVLELLRQPVEEGSITIARSAMTLKFPSSFMLIAAMNPCPCGFAGDPSDRCQCKPGVVRRYADRISGPLRDRIDLWVELLGEAYAIESEDQALTALFNAIGGVGGAGPLNPANLSLGDAFVTSFDAIRRPPDTLWLSTHACPRG